MSKNTGGPAFGNVISLDCVRVNMDGSEEYEPKVETGNLTVRDYFAAKAMMIMWDAYDKGYCGVIDPDTFDNDMLAKGAYQIADCMIEAREK